MIFLLGTDLAWSQTSAGPVYASTQDINPERYVIPSYTDRDITDRLEVLQNTVIPPQFTSIVRSYVNTYTVRKRQRTEAMLGRMDIYFPLFEKILLEKDAPVDLKYLPIVESALNAHAVSRAGAVGLWQFMSGTARENGLKINRYVDERKDPHKATEAAIKYLTKQYRRYGSWELALAAYNGGPGRVNRAIKRGRSKNFWRIKRYLPRETRNYISAFISACYIVNYYHLHNLYPGYVADEKKFTAATQIYKTASFNEISQITGVPIETIRYLNPAYKRDFIPSNSLGNYLILPQEGMQRFMMVRDIPDQAVSRLLVAPLPDPASLAPEGRFVKMIHTVEGNEQLAQVAAKYECSVEDIMRWNQMLGSRVSAGRALTVYMPQKKREMLAPFDPLEPKALQVRESPISLLNKAPSEESLESISLTGMQRYSRIESKKSPYMYHQIRRRERLVEIANMYDTTIPVLLELNELRSAKGLRPGMKIKVKKL